MPLIKLNRCSIYSQNAIDIFNVGLSIFTYVQVTWHNEKYLIIIVDNYLSGGVCGVRI